MFQGEHCEKCNPLFVGDPRNGGRCVSCTDFCHSHSDICVSKSDYLNKRDDIASLLQMYPDTKSAMFLNRVSIYLSVYLFVCFDCGNMLRIACGGIGNLFNTCV